MFIQLAYNGRGRMRSLGCELALSGSSYSHMLWCVISFLAGLLYSLSSFGLSQDNARLDKVYGCEALGLIDILFLLDSLKAIILNVSYALDLIS